MAPASGELLVRHAISLIKQEEGPCVAAIIAMKSELLHCAPAAGRDRPSGYCRMRRSERCQSGRMGQTRNLLSPLRGTVGSNPTLSASRIRSARSLMHRMRSLHRPPIAAHAADRYRPATVPVRRRSAHMVDSWQRVACIRVYLPDSLRSSWNAENFLDFVRDSPDAPSARISVPYGS